MRRSPAEYYIRYRLVNERTRPVDAIAKDLADELVHAATKTYLEDLRREMIIPRSVFQPYNLQHVPSQAFLQRHQIWSMYHPNRGTREAITIFGDMQPRTLLQRLVAGPHPTPVILDVFKARYPQMPLSEGGLNEFRHYFLNTKIVTLEELAEYTSVYLKDRTMVSIMRMPPSQDGMMMSMAKLGIMQDQVDEQEVYARFKRDFELSRAGVMRLEPGLSTMTALKMSFEGFRDATKELKAWGRETGQIIDEVEEFLAKKRELPNTTLRQLTAGDGLPFPVSALAIGDPDYSQVKDETDDEEALDG